MKIPAATMCSGIGAPELAAPEFDWLAASDIEPFSHAMYEQRWPHVERHGDLTQIDLKSSRYMDAEILVAGTPCQAFSHAGNRKGLDDPRGQITLKFVEAIHELASTGSLRLVVWENVPGVLSDESNAFGCFLGALVGIGYPVVPSRRPRNGLPNQLWRRIGRKRRRRNGKRQYRKPKLAPAWPSVGMVAGPRARIAWRVLDAANFGVPQRRRRVFAVVSFGASGPDPAAILFEPKGVRRDPAPREEARQDVAGVLTSGPGGRLANTLGAGDGVRGYRNDLENDTVVAQHNVLGVRGEVLHDGRNRDAGAGGVPEVRRGGGSGEDLTRAYGGNNTSGPIDIATAVNAHGGSHGRLYFESETFVCTPFQNTGQGYWRESDQAQTLRVGDAGVYEANVVAMNLRGREGGAMPELDDKASLRASSGGSSRSYVAFVQNQHDEVRLMGGDGSTGYAVRRLTPMECERLQGIPDNHTLIEFNGGPAADGRRYAGVGNSMAVPVVRWILMRAARELRPTEGFTVDARTSTCV